MISHPTPNRILRPAELVALLSISKPTLWRMRRRGEFPEPVRISPGCVGWPESTVREWLAEREAEVYAVAEPAKEDC